MFLDVSTELLRAGYSVRFRPGGHSMHPTIKNGQAVTVEPVNALAVKRGDIILYRTDRGVIAHRVISIEKIEEVNRTFILRGDTSISCDKPVKSEQILGKVVAVERAGRSINLSSRRAKIRCIARVGATRLKKRFHPGVSLVRFLFTNRGSSISASGWFRGVNIE